MPKGTYEVLVSQKGQGYFALVKIGGFFSTSHLSAQLSPEKQRTFVGYNPSNCMFYSSVLYSYICGGSFASINKHLPASATTPTYKQQIPLSSIDGSLEGIVKTQEGQVALIKQSDAEGASANIVYLLSNDLLPVKSMSLPTLEANSSYSISPYLSGFLVYDASFKNIIYFTSVGSAPTKININRPSGLQPTQLTIADKSITFVFSTFSTSGKEILGSKLKNEIVVYTLEAVNTHSLSGVNVSSAFTCGQDRICVLSSGDMLIYKTANQLSSPLFKIGRVNQAISLGKSLLLVRDGEVLNFDIDKRLGSIDYSYGDYHYCGVQAVDDSHYLMCASTGSQSAALYIDRSVNNTDNIDKKIQQLQKMPGVASLSVYGSYIFVSPDLGALVYDGSLGSYVYSSSAKKSFQDKLSLEINSLNLNTGGHKVINTSL